MINKIQEKQFDLNEQEMRLIQIIRETKYGELHVFISDSKPVRIEELKKSIKL